MIQRSTIRERILRLLKSWPGLSAYKIAQQLREDNSSVASICNQMTKRGALRREAGEGPRKGFGYYLADQKIVLDLSTRHA